MSTSSLPLPLPLNAPSPEQVAGVGAVLGSPSAYEAVRTAGFRTLSFPAEMETQYLDDKAEERLRLIRLGGLLLMALTSAMLAADWFMVPDRFAQALTWRVLIQTPLVIAGLVWLRRMPRVVREWQAFAMGLMSALITCHLSVTSQDPLATDYLVSLCLLVLFNGGVFRMRFWMAAASSLLVMVIFMAGALLLPHPPVAILLSSSLVLGSSAVFALLSSYRSEHEERANWLTTQHHKLLNAEVAERSRQLDRLSRSDPLTDLANRRRFDEFLQQVWSRARCDGQAVALLMIDIDHFKRYNDLHGHAPGDACIQRVAQALKASVRRPGDLIARYGGEEFAVVMPGADLNQAMRVAQRIRQDVAALAWPHGASPTSDHVTLSIGVAQCQADAPQASPPGLITAADAALYQAKAAGRDRAVAFEGQTPSHDACLAGSPPTAVPPLAPVTAPDPLQAQLTQAMAGLERPGLTLAFPDELEQRFQHEGRGDRLHYFALCGLAAFVVFNGFLLTDYLLVEDVFVLALEVRLGVFSPIALALLYMGWFQREWFAARSPWVAEATVTFTGMAAAACMGYILSASQSPLRQLYHAGLAVVIIYGNLVQRLRFGFALLFTVAVLTVHVLGMATLPAYNPRLTMPLALLMGSTALFTLMANHALERDERRRYLLTLNERQALAALETMRTRLETLSQVDALTGLFNRRHCHDYLQQVWRRASHDGHEVAIIILDVDHFKAYNDRHGHQAGDACLAQVAQAMKHALRQPGDLAARLGGEEFIAVLPHTSQAMARLAAERIRQSVQALALPHGASSAAEVVTVSLGVASCRAHPSRTDAALIAEADAALYQAKRNGRNRVSVAA